MRPDGARRRGPAAAGGQADSYEEENDHDHVNGEASFFYSATAVAALPGLRRVVLGATAEWHHNGGDIVGWSTLDGPPLITYLDGGDYHDNPFAIEVSPDGGVLATSVEGRWFAWSAATGERLWTLGSHTPWSGRIAPGSEIEEEDLDNDDHPDGDDLPAVCRLTFDVTPAGAFLEPVVLARPAQGPCGTDPAPLGQGWASWHAAWTVRGPLAHLAVPGSGGVLFDGDGRVLLTEPSHRVVSFSPDGRALVGVTMVGEDSLDPVDVWFLDALG